MLLSASTIKRGEERERGRGRGRARANIGQNNHSRVLIKMTPFGLRLSARMCCLLQPSHAEPTLCVGDGPGASQGEDVWSVKRVDGKNGAKLALFSFFAVRRVLCCCGKLG